MIVTTQVRRTLTFADSSIDRICEMIFACVSFSMMYSFIDVFLIQWIMRRDKKTNITRNKVISEGILMLLPRDDIFMSMYRKRRANMFIARRNAVKSASVRVNLACVNTPKETAAHHRGSIAESARRSSRGGDFKVDDCVSFAALVITPKSAPCRFTEAPGLYDFLSERKYLQVQATPGSRYDDVPPFHEIPLEGRAHIGRVFRASM